MESGEAVKLAVHYYVEHKFLESGHSYIEVDSIHSAIECRKKIKNANPYIVKELTNKDMVSYQQRCIHDIKACPLLPPSELLLQNQHLKTVMKKMKL
ncbi:hypothetical protein PR048_022244, partial [Dryococelus australis]